MGMIKGIPIVLYDKQIIGVDDFNRNIYRETPVIVENVIVSPITSEDIVNKTDLEGKKATYVLGIPKSDTHNWEDKVVEFFNEKWKTFGIPLEGIESMMPLGWNKKVMVERYE